MSNKSAYTFSWLSFSFLILLNACQNNKNSAWQKYYLSPKLANESLIYHYRGYIDGNPTERYVVHQRKNDSLKHIYFSSQGKIEQIILEQLLPDGIKTLNYTLMEEESAINAKIIQNNIFSFQPLEENEFLESKIIWTSTRDSSTNEVVKLRSYEKDTTIQYKGKSLPALIFNTREQIINTRSNTFTYDAHGREIYAQHIGLIQEVKHIEKAYRLKFELNDVLSPKDIRFYDE